MYLFAFIFLIFNQQSVLKSVKGHLLERGHWSCHIYLSVSEETEIEIKFSCSSLQFTGDNVGLSIAGVTIFETTKDNNYILSNKMSKADDYLSQFALYNFDAYCLGVVFTSVDFDGGVLGLAWVGYADPKGPPGGNNVARLFEMIIYWFFLKNVTFYFTKKLETRCK